MKTPDPDIRDKIIIALDVEDCAKARAIVGQLGEAGRFYKIGYRLAFTGGLDLAGELIDQGYKVFLDLKLHDIGHTIEEAVRAIAGMGATFLTVHAYPQTMKAACQGSAGSALQILGVTVLTSYDEEDLREAGYAAASPADLVMKRALQAREVGVHGLVCSAAEVARVRALVGPSVALVTPGIRPGGIAHDDQKRVATPLQAIRDGADYLVIGRPIIEAQDPHHALESIIASIRGS